MRAMTRTTFAAAALLFAQAAPRSVPVGQEPRHHVMFSNEYVRVIDAVIAPDDTTLFHTHSRDNVPVSISGGRMQTEVLGGSTTESTVQPGGAWFAKASYTHRISNVGTTTLRFIDAELVSIPSFASPLPEPIKDVPGLSLEIDNERVRVYRIRLDPGQSTGPHRHFLPGLEVVVAPSRLRVAGAGKQEDSDESPGQFLWRSGPFRHSIENVGDSRFVAFFIEWK